MLLISNVHASQGEDESENKKSVSFADFLPSRWRTGSEDCGESNGDNDSTRPVPEDVGVVVTGSVEDTETKRQPSGVENETPSIVDEQPATKSSADQDPQVYK